MPLSVAPMLATAEDVDQIAALVSPRSFRDDGSGVLLPLSAPQIARLVAEGRFAVAREGDRVIGCASLVEYGGIAELRSLVVADGYQSRGMGSRLARWCMDEAARRGHRRLFALTNKHVIDSFLKWGFVRTDTPPEKLSRDCRSCPLFHSDKCNEVALVLALPAA